jgi:hypothetical protein
VGSPPGLRGAPIMQDDSDQAGGHASTIRTARRAQSEASTHLALARGHAAAGHAAAAAVRAAAVALGLHGTPACRAV